MVACCTRSRLATGNRPLTSGRLRRWNHDRADSADKAVNRIDSIDRIVRLFRPVVVQTAPARHSTPVVWRVLAQRRIVVPAPVPRQASPRITMHHSLRLVTDTPLTELWTDAGPLLAKRVRALTRDELVALLQVAPV